MDFDCAIIGGGPSGLAAALSLSRQARKVAIFDSKQYRNDATSHMHNVIGFDHVEPAQFRKQCFADLQRRYGADMVHRLEKQVSKVVKIEKGFIIYTSNDEEFKARKIILATGARDLMPEIKGFADCWGKTIYHCLFCHGYEEKGTKHAGLFVNKPLVEMMLMHVTNNAALALNFAQKITVFTNGLSDADLAKIKGIPIIASLLSKGKITQINNSEIAEFARIEAHGHEEIELRFKDPQRDSTRLGFLVAPVPATLSNGSAKIAEQLGLELSANKNEIALKSMFNESSVRGVFIAGDVSTPVKAAMPAMVGGSMAGAGAAFQIATDAALD